MSSIPKQDRDEKENWRKNLPNSNES